MRPKKAPHRENYERWLVSYADFITLLFAFFVVMFATAQQDKSKAKQVAEAVRDAVEHGQLSNMWTSMMKPKKPTDKKVDSQQPGKLLTTANPQTPKDPFPKPATQADLAKSANLLRTALDPELKSGKITVLLNARGLVVSLREAAFFASGDDGISPSSLPILEKITGVIRSIPNPLRLEGHTDSVPIHTSRFRSNWELSAARSIAMLELLRARYQYPVERMSVAGYAENAPTDTNETEEGRAHNRRVDLVMVSAEAMNGEPAPGPRPQSAPARPLPGVPPAVLAPAAARAPALPSVPARK